MSADASTGASPPAEKPDYEYMLDRLDVLIDECLRKAESGRVYDAENEKVRIKWIRAGVYAIDTRRKVASDRHVEELNEKAERIEEVTEIA